MFAYKGKHACICQELEVYHKDDALSLIYAFFRSEDNTDDYSIGALTAIRELLEDGDSESLERVRIRMRSSGDKLLITLAQFTWAFYGSWHSDFADCAEILAQTCRRQFPKFLRSVQDFADEEGLSKVTELAGLRIREAAMILRSYFEQTGEEDAVLECLSMRLQADQIFLFTQTQYIAEDMYAIADWSAKSGNSAHALEMCQKLESAYSAQEGTQTAQWVKRASQLRESL